MNAAFAETSVRQQMPTIRDIQPFSRMTEGVNQHLPVMFLL
jgi:hypothetical protein